MLTRFDDYPIHQTPEPVAHAASSDRNVYDRYWFNGYADDGEFYFAVGMGLYPNRGILDCGFSVVRDGEQHAFHGSRRAPAEPSDSTVGPFRIEVLEPMRKARVTLVPNETGIECDLVFTARTGCVQEGRQTLRQGTRAFFDVTRFAQFGRWQGEIKYASGPSASPNREARRRRSCRSSSFSGRRLTGRTAARTSESSRTRPASPGTRTARSSRHTLRPTRFRAWKTRGSRGWPPSRTRSPTKKAREGRSRSISPSSSLPANATRSNSSPCFAFA